jgi:lipopolysaccharide biosynthesis glycosyltransferase
MLIASNKNFAAVHDFIQGSIVSTFNMGVVSLVPNISEFERLNKLRLTKRDYKLDMAEQGLLNAVYNNDYHEFPFEYNGNLAAAVQNRGFWDLHSKRLRVIHYTWIKPFNLHRNAHHEIEPCDGDCAKCQDVLNLWWSTYDEMMKKVNK